VSSALGDSSEIPVEWMDGDGEASCAPSTCVSVSESALTTQSLTPCLRWPFLLSLSSGSVSFIPSFSFFPRQQVRALQFFLFI
jgi:hypothetical protein